MKGIHFKRLIGFITIMMGISFVVAIFYGDNPFKAAGITFVVICALMAIGLIKESFNNAKPKMSDYTAKHDGELEKELRESLYEGQRRAHELEKDFYQCRLDMVGRDIAHWLSEVEDAAKKKKEEEIRAAELEETVLGIIIGAI